VAAQHRAAADELLELEARRARLVTELDGGSTVEPPPGWAALPDEDRARADIILSRQQTELRARQRTLEAQSGALQSQRAQLDADIASYTAQIRASRQQQTLIEEELTGLRRLADRGLVTATRLRALERAQAELIGQQQSLEAQIARAREGRSESGLQSVVLREGRAAEIGEQIGAIDLRLSELRPSLEALTARLESTRIRAPASGRVVGLAVFTEGGVISAGQRLMDIVPEQQPLVVNAQINPQDADDLRAGMEARLRFVGLHDRRTPLLTGTVQFVSADRLIDERTGQSYFTAQIAVSPEELGRLNVVDGASVAVTPGQPVEVLVPLRARTALQYMSDPLAQALWRSFREH
jgi:HlyD family secretion protein